MVHTQQPKVTRYGNSPTVPAELATKAYVDTGGLLDDHTASGAEATYTFTLPTALTSSDFDTAEVHIRGSVTAALGLNLTINGASALYEWDRIANDAGTVSATRQAGQAEVGMIPNGILDAAGRIIDIIIKISLNQAEGAINFNWIGGGAGEGNVFGVGTLAGETTLASITIATTTSTWKINSRITTRVSRV